MNHTKTTTKHMIDLSSYLGLLAISGLDAKKFLQGQLTCHLDEITATQTRLGAHCNPQGRIISLFRIYWYQDQYLLQMPRSLIPIAMAALNKYAVFFKVQIDKVSDQFNQIGYIGETFPILPQHRDDAVIVDEGLLVRVSTESQYCLIRQKREFSPTHPEEAWKQIEIRNHIPAIYPETSEKFLPHDLNLPLLNGVSFKKGCYTGQEIIARMEYRGKLKNKLQHATVQMTTPPERGHDIYRGQERYGYVVDYCQVGYNQYELLFIAPEWDATTTPLSLDPDQKNILQL